MKLYLNRFIHHVGGLPTLSALQFTHYDQYESIVKPIVKYLEDKGAKFKYGVTVKDVDFDISEDRKVATKLVMQNSKGEDISIDLTENYLVSITNGCLTEASVYRDNWLYWKFTQRSSYTGKTVTGGIVTVKDSSWLISWTFNRQPQLSQ